MMQVRVTQYIESWHGGKNIVALYPGDFSYGLVKDMLGEEFMQHCLDTGAIRLVPAEQQP